MANDLQAWALPSRGVNRDTIIGIVGAVILVIALVGVFRFEKSNPGGAADVWSQVAAPGPTLKGTTNVGAKTDTTVTLAKQNLTKAVFTVTWTAANGKDTVALTITPPAGFGNATTVTNDGGKAEVTIDIPNAQPVGAARTLGTGDWKVTVEFKSADLGAPVPVPVTPPAGTDASVTWSLATTLTAWEPRAGTA